MHNGDWCDRILSKVVTALSQAWYPVSAFSCTARNWLKSTTFNQEKFARDLSVWAKNSFLKNRAKFEESISRLNRQSVIAYCSAASFIPSNREDLALIEYIATNALAHANQKGRDVTPYAFFRLSALAFKIQQSEVWTSMGPREEAEAFSARIESITIRGTGRRPDQSIGAALYRFGVHNEWLKKHLGFTIEQAIQATNDLFRWVDYGLEPLLAEGNNYKGLDELGLSFSRLGSLKAPLRSVVALIQNALTFRPADIPTRDQAVLANFLRRFSAKEYVPQNSFGDDISLYDRPIIEHGGEFFLPFPSLLVEGLPESFYKDLRTDKSYWSKNSQKKGKAAESRIVDLLCRAFPRDFVFPNPSLRRGSELVDALVVFEDVALIIESKSRYLSREARKKAEIVSDYLKETVKEGLRQTQNAETALRSGKIKRIRNVRGSKIDLVNRAIHRHLTILILDERLSILVIHEYLMKNKESLSDLPFIVDINDLEYIIEEFDTPREFIKYLQDRQAFLVSGKYHVPGELDLLGYYKINGRSFPAVSNDEQVNHVMLDRFWESYQEKYAEVNIAKTKDDEISYFVDHIIERAHEAGSGSVVIAEELSKLTRTERRSLAQGAFQKAMQAARDSEPHYALCFFLSVDYGIVFLFTPEDRATRIERLKALVYLARISLSNPKVIGIASEPANHSSTTIDYCLIDKPIESDDDLRRLASQFFRDAKYFNTMEYSCVKKHN